jgi:hypothetical protein
MLIHQLEARRRLAYTDFTSLSSAEHRGKRKHYEQTNCRWTVALGCTLLTYW